ncbi:hypothetical protein Leryth_022730 [Lithospermum erythrorhizon]|nr:hypothetical protein Leryth_022730 [Lithospermum erythrorhizon]
MPKLFGIPYIDLLTSSNGDDDGTVGQPHPHGQSAKEIKRKRNPNKSRKRLILAREFAMDRLKVSRQKKRRKKEALKLINNIRTSRG